MHGGVRRLLLLTAAPTASVGHRATDRRTLARTRLRRRHRPALVDDCIAAAIDDVMRHHGVAAVDPRRVRRAARGGAARGARTGRGSADAGGRRRSARPPRRVRCSPSCTPTRCAPSVDDANVHLGRLVRPGFVLASGIDRLDDIERYVRAITYRLEHLAGGAERDRHRMAEVLPLEQRYAQLVDSLGPGRRRPACSTSRGSSRSSASPRSPSRSWSSARASRRSAPSASPPPSTPRDDVAVSSPHRHQLDDRRLEELTGDTVELLQTLIRNVCVNDGSPESGEEVRNADVLQNYIEGPGVTDRTVRADAGARVDRRADRGHRSRRSLAVPDGPHRCRAGQPGRMGRRSVRRRGLDTADGARRSGGAVRSTCSTSRRRWRWRSATLARSGFRPTGDLMYFAVADEEAGQRARRTVDGRPPPRRDPRRLRAHRERRAAQRSGRGGTSLVRRDERRREGCRLASAHGARHARPRVGAVPRRQRAGQGGRRRAASRRLPARAAVPRAVAEPRRRARHPRRVQGGAARPGADRRRARRAPERRCGVAPPRLHAHDVLAEPRRRQPRRAPAG